MKTPYERIKDHEKLTAIYHHWPSFHDSEVVSAHLERDAGEPLTGPVLTLKLHVFRLEVAPDDPSRDNRVVTFRFNSIERLQLREFNHQNAIIEFAISSKYCERLKKDLFSVHLKQGFGIDCSFECATIEVVAVEPYTPRSY